MALPDPHGLKDIKEIDHDVNAKSRRVPAALVNGQNTAIAAVSAPAAAIAATPSPILLLLRPRRRIFRVCLKGRRSAFECPYDFLRDELQPVG